MNELSRCPTNVLETRQNLSDEIKSVIHLVTHEHGLTPVGTFRYNIFKYPGDIDIFENIEECCDFSTSKLTAAQKIQSIVRNIITENLSSKVMFVEFKAGYDLRFKIYTGVVNNKIEDYNPDLIRRDITNLYEANLLTYEEWTELMYMIKDDPTIETITELNEKLREYWVLRWTELEVLQGYKMLRGNYKLFLDIAISQGTIVKLDTIAYIDSRFVEVTNFFLITTLDKFGHRSIISQELSDYGQSLLLDVYKYYEINPLKAIKRLWMYLAYKGRICDLSIFTPLFESNIALYSQVLSDVETAIQLLSPNFCDKFMKTYGSYMILFNSLNFRLQLLDGICQPMNYYEQDISEILDDLMKVQKCLREYVNNKTYDWLQEYQVNIFDLIQESDTVTPSAILSNQAEGLN